MWILKNSKELLETLNSILLSEYKSRKTYDLSTHYTSILHTQLKSRLKKLLIIHCCYAKKKDGTPRYIVLKDFVLIYTAFWFRQVYCLDRFLIEIRF